MKNIFLVLSIIILPSILIAQNYSISGYIADTKDERLPSATVVVMSQIDSTMAGFALSANDGRFIIRDLEEGDYEVQVSYLGYEQHSQNVSLTPENSELDLNTIVLQTSSTQITEVVVKGENIPVQVKKDTIVYNADAFKTQPNDVVEDLLRQMPGIEVEDDGTIVAQGEEVQKVTVDGKEFFGNDPKIATKNLPAKAIDKVEIFDKKSDQAEFSGIDDGERTKTMNLELKEDYKKGFFGNVEAGGGYEEMVDETRYKTRGNINRFSKKSQISIIGNLNNINEQGFSTGDYMSFMTSMGGFGGGRNRQGNSGISINQGLSDGYVNTGAGGININYDLTDKTDINASYFINDVSNDINSITMRESFVNGGRSIFSDDILNQLSDNRNHNITLRVEHEIDSTQDVRLESSLKINDANLTNTELSSAADEAGNLINTGVRDYESTGDNITPAGSLLYRKKIGRKSPWVVTLKGTLNQTSSDSEGDLNSETDFAPDDPSMDLKQILLQNQLNKDDENAYRIDATLTQPLGNNQYLDYSYRRSNTSNDVATEVYDIDGSMSTFNEALSTMYIRDYTYDRVGLSWQYSGDQSSITLGGQVQKSVLDGQLFDTNQNIYNDNVAFLPSAQFRYEIDRGHNFRIRYSTDINQPSLTQLQPVVDQSDPLNLYVGNPDLEVEYGHNLRMNYIKWDQFNFSSLFAFMTINYKRDNIINQVFIDENFVQTTSPVNVSDDLSVRTNISYSRPIRSIGAKVRVGLNNTYQNSIQFINTIKNDVNRYNTGLSLTLENRNKEKYSLSASSRWTYNTNVYSENSDQNLSYLNQSYEVGARLDAIKGWSFASDLDLRYYSEQDFSPSETIPIWKASISKYFLPGDKGEFRISAFDLLNKNAGINRTSNANYVENEFVNSLGRYFMASFLYSFSSAGGEAAGGSSKTRMIRMH